MPPCGRILSILALCHYELSSVHVLVLWFLSSAIMVFMIFLCVVIVAEDVSLTGGGAVQRIRLIDEEEQVFNLCR